MRLKEIMSEDVQTIHEGEVATSAYERMRVAGIKHLVVVDGRAIIGVVSERDLGGKRAGHWREHETVSTVMSTPAVIAKPETTLKEAANMLRGRGIGCLPVVSDDKLVGIVTASDILELIGRGAEKPSPRGTRATLSKRGPRRSGARGGAHA